MRDIESVRRLTERYPYLQGLRMVPVGAWVAGVGVATSQRWSEGGSGVLIAVVLAVLAGVALLMINGYYARRYGMIVVTPEQKRRDGIATIFGVGVLTTAAAIEATWEWDVSLYGLAVVLVSLMYWCYTGGLRLNHWVVAAVTVGVSVSPVVGMTEPGADVFMWVLVTAGLAYVVTGVLDHLYLVGEMKPSEGVDVA